MSKVSFSSSARALSSFASRVTAWQKKHGRHDLPWQNTRDPYRIWLSEIMLQQTQVDTVMNYYARFLEAFPDVTALARAPIAQVLALWSGLGYYRRAHHLHEAAKIIAQMGAFPDTQETLMDLPGVGRSTAAAIAVFAFNRRAAIMDGNVRRVLTRHQNIVDHRGKDTDPALWAKAESLLPRTHLVAYTQGMMDLGATVCKRTSPKCSVCPVAQDCGALAENRAEVLPPSRAPKVEERAFWLWVIRHKEHLLFEERAEKSIWSGLFSFPEFEPDTPKTARTKPPLYDIAQSEIKKRYGLSATSVEFDAPITHRLTHRKLVMTPVIVTVRGKKIAQDRLRGEVWMTRDEAMIHALPTPVRRWLEKKSF